MSIHCLYEFHHPQTNKVLYVGVTSNPARRFKDHLKHIKYNKYIRHPFKCVLQSLHAEGYSYETLLHSFQIVESGLDESIAYQKEIELIGLYGIENLKNISTGGKGGDRFTYHPNKKTIQSKLRKRIPWNKGKRGLQTANKTSFTSDPRTIYRLTNQAGESFEFVGSKALKEFCNWWNETHKVIWVKDPNWLSFTALLLAVNKPKSFKGSLKGWSIEKVSIKSPQPK